MYNGYNTVSPGSLGVLRARGADVVAFLQGQLSNDVTRLGADRSLFAGYHNPQGRVIALLRLVQLADNDVLAVLPRELTAPLALRLAKFVLRAKVRLADESAQWTVRGILTSPSASPPGALPADLDAAARIEEGIAIRVAQQPPRWLLLSPQPAPPPPAGAVATGELWQRLALAGGEPEVYGATSEEFVAQMLNLDALGAIAFDKGCYTGQEVIARAHYRGRVKRRMQRFLSEAAAVQLAPGDSGVLADGRTFRVVRAAQHADGRVEFLAVTTLLSDAPPAAERRAGAGAPLAAESLALPYEVPE